MVSPESKEANPSLERIEALESKVDDLRQIVSDLIDYSKNLFGQIANALSDVDHDELDDQDTYSPKTE